MGVNVALLRDLSLFRDLTENQLEKVATLCSEVPVFSGETFCREGEPAKAFFVVSRDEVEILYTAGGDAMACREWVGTGEVLGIRALIPPYKYSATLRGVTEGTLLAVDVIKLVELLQQDDRLAECLLVYVMRTILSRNTTLRSLL